jgi:hypothetical protein
MSIEFRKIICIKFHGIIIAIDKQHSKDCKNTFLADLNVGSHLSFHSSVSKWFGVRYSTGAGEDKNFFLAIKFKI